MSCGGQCWKGSRGGGGRGDYEDRSRMASCGVAALVDDEFDDDAQLQMVDDNCRVSCRWRMAIRRVSCVHVQRRACAALNKCSAIHENI